MSSPAGIAVPEGGNQDHAAPLIATYWTLMFFAISIVALRFWARRITKNIGWDDWLMLISLIMQVTLAGFVTKYALIGGTRHLYYLSPSEIEQVLKWSYVFQCWGIFACTPTKASVAILIYRIMKPLKGWRYWTLIVTIVILFLTNALDSIFTYVQCNPAAALWDRTITDADCWDPSVQANISIAQGCYNVFADAVLAVIPATFLYKLQMDMKRKIGLIVLLGLGLLAAIAGSIKTSMLAQLSARSDLTWEMYDLIIWAGVENWVVLMCGSVPPLKPLWSKYLSKGEKQQQRRAPIDGVRRTDGVTLMASDGFSKGSEKYTVSVSAGTGKRSGSSGSSSDSIDREYHV